jgi:hypothetical protein
MDRFGSPAGFNSGSGPGQGTNDGMPAGCALTSHTFPSSATLQLQGAWPTPGDGDIGDLNLPEKLAKSGENKHAAVSNYLVMGGENKQFTFSDVAITGNKGGFDSFEVERTNKILGYGDISKRK